jgi:hypothetical protein
MPTFEQIGTAVVVGSGGSPTINFSSIPATFTDLMLKTSLRGVAADTWIEVRVTFNGTTSGYTSRHILGAGSGTPSSSTNPFTNSLGRSILYEGTSFTASTFASSEMYISNYASSNNKSTSSESVTENNGTTAISTLEAGLWSNSAAINQITLTGNFGNFAEHSTAYLYGVSNA